MSPRFAEWRHELTLQGDDHGVRTFALLSEDPASGKNRVGGTWLEVSVPEHEIEMESNDRAYIMLPFDTVEEQRRLVEWLETARVAAARNLEQLERVEKEART